LQLAERAVVGDRDARGGIIRLLRQRYRDFARGAFNHAPPTVGELSRAMNVDRRR